MSNNSPLWPISRRTLFGFSSSSRQLPSQLWHFASEISVCPAVSWRCVMEPHGYMRHSTRSGVSPQGLPSLDDFKTTFPVRSITPSTQVFGLLGDPVGHSFGPLLHNHMYQRLGVNALYLPFRVPRGMLPQAVEAYDHIPVSGYSVTIPHKEAAVQIARGIGG